MNKAFLIVTLLCLSCLPYRINNSYAANTATAENLTERPPAAQPKTAPAQSKALISLADDKDLHALVLNTRTPFRPYVGAGLNADTSVPEEAALVSESEEEKQQNYRLGFGIDCKIDKSTVFGVAYRYLTNALPLRNNPLASDDDGDKKEHHLSFGLTHLF